MKSYVLTIIGALMISGANMSAQDYDDVYYNTATKQKTSATTKKEGKSSASIANKNPYFTKYAKTSLKSDTTSAIVNGRDIDEYNRRYTDDAKQYYADEYAAYDSDSTETEDFKYTDRIVKFHNADVVVHSNDPELIELYYDNRPQVNLIVGTTYTGWYNDPFNWGYYDPWYSWSWGSPYRYGWYAGWYDPWYSWSWNWSWHSGWYDPWCSWGWGHPHYSYSHWHGWGPGFYGARYSDGGRMTSGYRNNRNGVFNGNNLRPGYATTNTRRNGFSGGSSTRNDNSASGRLNYLRRGREGFGTNTSGSNNFSRPGTSGTIRRSAGSQATDNMNERRNSFITRERQSSNYRSNDRNTFDNNRQSNSFNNSRRSSGGFSGGGFGGGTSRGGGSFGGGGRRR